MAAFIEVDPRNAFQGNLLVNIDDIKCKHPLVDRNEKLAVLRHQSVDAKPVDLEESYEEVKSLISKALDEGTDE
jgi:chaperonin cofactor prefoldin